MFFFLGRFLPRPLRPVAGLALLVVAIAFHLIILAISGGILLAVGVFQLLRGRQSNGAGGTPR